MTWRQASIHPIENQDVWVCSTSNYFFNKPNSIKRSVKNSPAFMSTYNFGYSELTQEGRQLKSISERGCMKRESNTEKNPFFLEVDLRPGEWSILIYG